MDTVQASGPVAASNLGVDTVEASGQEDQRGNCSSGSVELSGIESKAKDPKTKPGSKRKKKLEEIPGQQKLKLVKQ